LSKSYFNLLKHLIAFFPSLKNSLMQSGA
jgi:hypothetical protein